jgi:hypothetical protein
MLDLGEHEEWELERAIAMSLREHEQAAASPDARAGGSAPTSAGPSRPPPPPAPASGGRRPAAKKGPPPFDPTDAEVAACFATLTAASGGRVTPAALLAAARTLGLELIDYDTAAEMLGHAADVGAAPAASVARRGLDAAEFAALVRHFAGK